MRTYVSETILGRVYPGMKADITSDSFPDRHHSGWVGFISPTAEFTPKPVETTDPRSRAWWSRPNWATPVRSVEHGEPAFSILRR